MLAIVELLVWLRWMTSGATVQVVSNRHPAPPAALRMVHHPLHDPRQTLLWVNASSLVVPDHLQPRRVPILLSNLRPSDPLASTAQRSFHLVVALGTCKPVFSPYSLTVPAAASHSIWPRHSFGTSPTILKFFFSLERAPSALAAIGNICSPYTHFIRFIAPFVPTPGQP